MKILFLLFICSIALVHFSDAKPFYIDYININEENTKLFYRYYESFYNITSDPKEYVVKTDCVLNEDLEKELGRREFIKGDKGSAMIFYTYENKIKDYFTNHPSCSFEYEELSLLIKLLTLDKISDEYVIKFRDNSNKEEKNMIMNGVDFYVDELQSSKLYKTKKVKSEKDKSVINYENILKLMKNNRNTFKKVRENKLLKRNLNSVNYRILHSSLSEYYTSDTYIRLSINDENEDEVLSYILLEPMIESIDPKLKIKHNTLRSSHNNSKICGVKSNQAYNHFRYTESFSTGVKYLGNKLTGKNIVIGIGDTGLDTSHCLFRDTTASIQYNTKLSNHRKVQGYESTWGDKSDIKDGHGTHVCGIAAGALQNEDSEANSLAKDSKIAFIDIQVKDDGLTVPEDLSKYFDRMKDYGSIISSNSWGAEYYKYSMETYSIDEYAYNNPHMVILFAAGNEGELSGISIDSQAQGKNIITVGASHQYYATTRDTKYYITYFSSQGPTNDDRIKPDISFMGDEIWSSAASQNNPVDYNSCCVVTKSGTSMATPLGASAVAIIEQYLQEGYYPTGTKVSGNGFTPTSSLVKAMLIHSGENAKGYYTKQGAKVTFKEWPNHKQGFGIASLDKVLYFADNPHFRLELIKDNNRFYTKRDKYTKTVYYNPKQKFKVTLVWNDPPVKKTSRSFVLNDLDLTVEINDTIIYPNGLVYPDRYNNVEVITIPQDFIKGDRVELTIEVTCYELSKEQLFNLVITGDYYDRIDETSKSYNVLTAEYITNPLVQSYSPPYNSTDIDDSSALALGVIVVIVVLIIIICCCICFCTVVYFVVYRKPSRINSNNGEENVEVEMEGQYPQSYPQPQAYPPQGYPIPQTDQPVYQQGNSANTPIVYYVPSQPPPQQPYYADPNQQQQQQPQYYGTQPPLPPQQQQYYVSPPQGYPIY